ncbi:MAG: DNA polymerase III subunit gamma/tau [Oscillospiraceae bacterium]|nr:DNA polymerase III subunit gamma/tau [Oscillospiraceae bacterium]
MYQALYRKWRPKTFDDVVGQQHVTDTLKRQVLLNRLSHAYLFTGTRGTGKTTCAKLLARAVNCENPVGGNPCGKCAACVGIENGSILDVLEIDAASNNSVDNVRALREDAVYTPASVKMRVYIIDEVHMLSNSAFNALLKILEEPPEHLMFILATTELHKVPATILSRCQRYSFKRVSQEDIAARLGVVAKAEGIQLSEEACEMLSRMADGALRDALSLLDQCSGDVVDKERVISAIGVADTQEICRIFEAIKSRNGSAAMDILNELYMNGRDVASVLDRLAELYRDLLMTRLAPKGGSSLLKGGFTAAELSALSQGAEVPNLLAGLDVLEEAISGLRGSSNRRIAAELCLLRLCDYAPAEPVQTYAQPQVVYVSAPAPAAVEKSPELAPAPVADDLPWEAPPAPDDYDAPPAWEPPVYDEPEPVYEAPAPVPEPAPAPVQSGGGVDWKAVLRGVKSGMDDYIFNILADESQIEAAIEDGLIRVMWKNPFAMSMVDESDIKLAIAEVAKKLSGGNWRVSVEEYHEGAKTTQSKLDRLMSRFDIKYDDEGE